MAYKLAAWMRMPRVLVVIVGIVLLIVFPLINTSEYLQHLVIVALLYAVLACNWDLTLGYAGVFNWAHIAFFALGAYAAGILAKSFGVSPWLCILAGAAVAVVASVLVCLPVLRVKGLYVALVTFAFGELCLHIVVSFSQYTGGSQGLVLIPPITIGSYSFMQNQDLGYYYLAVALFLASTVFLALVIRSHFGLSIMALRDYEDYAISRGVPLARQRLLTFMLSAIFTGATGAVYGFYLGVVSPELFGFGYTATLISMVLLGGISTLYGSVLGAFVLTFVSEFLVSLGPWRYVIVSSIIVGVLLFYPEGVYPGLQKLFRRLRVHAQPKPEDTVKGT
ncbi:MAG: branched-chain amino acid ABC transporter permease [Anaerolineales bacterium]|jgi:branched-chain amino acid transport system permease protein